MQGIGQSARTALAAVALASVAAFFLLERLACTQASRVSEEYDEYANHEVTEIPILHQAGSSAKVIGVEQMAGVRGEETGRSKFEIAREPAPAGQALKHPADSPAYLFEPDEWAA